MGPIGKCVYSLKVFIDLGKVTLAYWVHSKVTEKMKCCEYSPNMARTYKSGVLRVLPTIVKVVTNTLAYFTKNQKKSFIIWGSRMTSSYCCFGAPSFGQITFDRQTFG